MCVIIVAIRGQARCAVKNGDGTLRTIVQNIKSKIQRNAVECSEMQRNEEKWREMERNAVKCREMKKNGEKWREMQWNAVKCSEM